MLLPFQASLRLRRSINVKRVADSPTLSASDTVVDSRDTPFAPPSAMGSSCSVPFILIIGGPKGPNVIRVPIASGEFAKRIMDSLSTTTSILAMERVTATTYAFPDSLLS